MKKILLVGTHRTMPSGVSTHINQLIASPLINKFNFDNFVIGSESCQESKLSKIKRYILSPVSLAIKIISFQPDIVHLNPSMDFKGFFRDAVYLFIAKLLGKKVVLQLHAGLKPQVFFNQLSCLYRPRRLVLQTADAVILLTQLEAKHAAGFCHFKALTVVPNAIDVTVFTTNVTEKNNTSDEITLVYIGRLVDEKGIKESIEALSLLKQQGYKNVTFKIAGTGPYEQSLKHLVDELNVNDNVEFMGPIFGEQKIQFWHDATILVFPTYFDEGLPYTLLEALASGTPSITTRVGGIPEVIEDGIHGLFVEEKNPEAIANAIKTMVSDKSLLKTMSEECIKRANEHYSIARLSKQIEAIYENLQPK